VKEWCQGKRQLELIAEKVEDDASPLKKIAEVKQLEPKLHSTASLVIILFDVSNYSSETH
jgi:hypothetical protein